MSLSYSEHLETNSQYPLYLLTLDLKLTSVVARLDQAPAAIWHAGVNKSGVAVTRDHVSATYKDVMQKERILTMFTRAFLVSDFGARANASA
jgi:hypothetical protein